MSVSKTCAVLFTLFCSVEEYSQTILSSQIGSYGVLLPLPTLAVHSLPIRRMRHQISTSASGLFCHTALMLRPQCTSRSTSTLTILARLEGRL